MKLLNFSWDKTIMEESFQKNLRIFAEVHISTCIALKEDLAQMLFNMYLQEKIILNNGRQFSFLSFYSKQAELLLREISSLLFC